MRHTRVFTVGSLATALVAAGVVAVMNPATADRSAPAQRAAQAEKALRGASDQTPTIAKDSAGRVRAVVARPGHPLRRPDGLAAGGSAESVARGFVRTYGAAFGLADADRNLATLRTDTMKSGTQIVHLQQRVDGVPVIGGDVVVTTRPGGAVVSATAALAATDSPRTGSISMQAAIRTAVARAAKSGKVSASVLTATATRWVYDRHLVNPHAPRGSMPVWRVAVDSVTAPEAAREILVDAEYGDVVLVLQAHPHAKRRTVCDFANKTLPDPPKCLNVARTEGGPASGITDVNKAYDYAGATYDFYLNNFGRDSIDGNGMQIVSWTRVCMKNDCPYYNAFWNGQQMVYGENFAAADDVVGHELTHGVTERTSGLYYGFQSGAINESLSDIMGEFIDQTNKDGSRDNDPYYDWLVGEDLDFSGTDMSPYTALRSMSDPTSLLFNGDTPDPDRMTSPYYVGEEYDPQFYGVEPVDNGGVHTNSGVGNKTAYLIAAAGSHTFNGRSVKGIGIAKAAQVYYRTMNLLNSAADYADLALTLTTACGQLQSEGVAGITTDDCTQVQLATEATELAQAPAVTTAQVAQAKTCPTGATADVITADGFEQRDAGPWTVPASNWYYPTTGNWGRNAREGKVSALGLTKWDKDPRKDPSAQVSYLTWKTPIDVPVGKATFVHFLHDTWFEQRGGKNLDGGKVEYRVDGGSWTDAYPLFTDNGPNGPMAKESGFSGNAFVGNSRGFTSSRLELSPFSGRKVELRFTIVGNDNYESAWWIDDVKAYTCSGSAPGPLRGVKAVGDVGSATLSWRPSEVTSGALSSYALTASPAVASLPASVPADHLSQVVTGLAPGTAYTFTVTPMYGSTAGQEQTVTTKPTGITIAGAPNSVTWGAKTTLSGHASVVGGGNGAYATVRILGRPAGSTSWTTVGAAAATSTGDWSYAVGAPQNYEYAAQFVGGENLNGSQSSTVGVSVAPRVTLAASKSEVKHGTAVAFTGATTPSHAYVDVTLQVYENKAWKTIGSTKTYSGGNFGLSVKLNTKGNFAYRVIVAGDATYAAGSSPSVSVKTT